MKNIIVEAGHYYQVNGPSMLSVKGWEIGKEYAASQENAGLVLLIDDYHDEQTFLEPGDKFLPPADANTVADAMTTEADYVFSEAALAQTAPQKIGQLLDDGLVKLQKGVLSVGGVRLGCLR